MQIIVDATKIQAVKSVLRGLNINADVHIAAAGGNTYVNLEGRGVAECQSVLSALKATGAISTAVGNPFLTNDEIPTPVPTLTSLAPSSVSGNPTGVILTVNGTNFGQGARILFGRGTLPTNFINPTALTCTLGYPDTRPGNVFQVGVINNDYQVSNKLPFTTS
jgi:IPT/TIG domain